MTAQQIKQQLILVVRARIDAILQYEANLINHKEFQSRMRISQSVEKTMLRAQLTP